MAGDSSSSSEEMFTHDDISHLRIAIRTDHCFELDATAVTIRGFPVQKYKEDRWGLVATYWGFGLQIGRALITQNDYNKSKGVIEGSVLNHVSG